MASAGGGRVEFVGLRAGPEPEAEEFDGNGRAWSGEPPRRWWLVAALVVLALAGLVAREVSLPVAAEAPTRAQPLDHTHYGLVGLPVTFGALRQLAAQTDGGDIVWVGDDGGDVARVEAGDLAATRRLAAPVTALAVDPTATELFVATGGSTPAVSLLDARTLAVRGAVTVDRPLSVLAVDNATVWGGGVGGVVAFSTPLLRPLAALPLPGVGALAHLEILPPVGSYSQSPGRLRSGLLLTVVAVGGDGAPNRLLLLTPGTGAVTTLATSASPLTYAVASGQLWVAQAGPTGVVVSAEDPERPGAGGPSSDPLPAGATVWPGGGPNAWVAAMPASNLLACFDDRGRRVGLTGLGDNGVALAGPVVAAGVVFYGLSAAGRLVRGALGTCR